MAFPLRLCPFEEYLLLDDTPSFPMNFFLLLRFDGHLRYDLWNSAVSRTLAQHPLLHANVQKVGRKRIQWVRSQLSPPKIVPIESGTLSGDYNDLERQTGLRITAMEDGQEFSLLFQFHHSCCDGEGGCQFIEDVLLEYARASNGAHEAAQPKGPNLLELRRRGRFGLTPLKFVKLAPRQLIGLLGARQFMMRNPQPLTDCPPVGTCTLPPPGYPSRITHRFSVDQTRIALRRTKQLAVTLNDLIIRDLLLAIDNFKSPTEARDDDWLRLTVPVSLRDFTPADMPATNIMSLVFLDRRRRDMCDPDRLLISLNEEMNLIKRNKLGLTFVLSLAAVRSFTGSLAELMPKEDECSATAVLTNLGILFKDSSLAGENGKLLVGDLQLADVEFIAPFRPNTCATFSAYTYANQLRVTMHFDPRSLSGEEARSIHSDLIQRLSESINA